MVHGGIPFIVNVSGYFSSYITRKASIGTTGQQILTESRPMRMHSHSPCKKGPSQSTLVSKRFGKWQRKQSAIHTMCQLTIQSDIYIERGRQSYFFLLSVSSSSGISENIGFGCVFLYTNQDTVLVSVAIFICLPFTQLTIVDPHGFFLCNFGVLEQCFPRIFV